MMWSQSCKATSYGIVSLVPCPSLILCRHFKQALDVEGSLAPWSSEYPLVPVLDHDLTKWIRGCVELNTVDAQQQACLWLLELICGQLSID